MAYLQQFRCRIKKTQWKRGIDDEDNEREIDYPEELNPFAQEEENEAAIVNQPSVALAPELTSAAPNGFSSTFLLPNEEKSDDEQNENVQQGNEYPESLNPFASEDEEDGYSEELNPFAQEEKDEADSKLVNQSATTLSNELTAPPSNCSSSKFPLPNEEKLDNEQDESGQQGREYPDILNPFASKDEADDYPEALNPFAREDGASLPQSSSETSCPVPSIYKDNEYDEALIGPFSIEDGDTEQHEDGYPEELNPFAHENQSSSKIVRNRRL
ncbi:hypothetical protein JTE90_029202 [Oedothorax gibbosus]|uniref:Uncharacterized protein n=1 Tax=Oedothorax gibbosus TaxID=931172 RepID=A0AAV6VC30_9ARAC|nr:hypothetical protein JTE90_029202 [Oedothorax gibbosus]